MKAVSLPGFLIFCVLLIVGCSSQIVSDVPKPEMAKKFLKDYIAEKSKGNIRLVDFKKRDGVAREKYGVKGYTLEFEAKVEMLKNGVWWYGGDHMYQFMTPEEGDMGWVLSNDILNPNVGVVKPAKKGEQVFIIGSMDFTKKESGWTIGGAQMQVYLGEK